jgi:hypothetical protein
LHVFAANVRNFFDSCGQRRRRRCIRCGGIVARSIIYVPGRQCTIYTTTTIVGKLNMSLNGRKVKGVLLDITGVLAESSSTGDGTAIQGSVEAVKKLKSAGNI